MKKRILFYILKYLAKGILRRYHPIVIGITGSIGKTTTKDAIAYILSDTHRVGSTQKNFNNEIGLPLTILGETSTPGKNIADWIRLFFRALVHTIYFHNYPEILVLEMGVDHPGDMKYLLSIVRPDIAVVTGISSTHLEFFGTVESIFEEKGLLIQSLSKNGTALLNADNMYSRLMKKDAMCRTILYGFSKNSTIRATNKVFLQETDQMGVSFKLEYKDKVIPIRLRNIVGKHHIEAILPGIAIAELMGRNLLEIAKKWEYFLPPVGRFRLIQGQKGSYILDDTYNASPVSTRCGIASLGDFKKEDKIVVLGDMLELGKEEKEAHRSLQEDIEKIQPKQVILVGKRMKALFLELEKNKDRSYGVEWVGTPYEAPSFALPLLHKNTVVFVKGSQSMRMEIVVEALMENPKEASKLLCRQDKRWKEIPFKIP